VLLGWMPFLLACGCATESRPAVPTRPTTTQLAASPATAPAPIATRPAAPRTLEMGRSVEGRPLTLYLFGDDRASSGTTLILGGIHGNEPTAAGVCRELVALLTASPDLWAGRSVAILPEANPDGLARKLRTNANLVDLNRNFSARNWQKTRRSGFFGGDAPDSEPETQALVSLLDRLRPARIVSVHAMWQPCNNFDGPAVALAGSMSEHNGYPVRASIGYPTPGSLGSYAGADRQIPTITLELPANHPTARSWNNNREALLAAIQSDPVSQSAIRDPQSAIPTAP
jgi:murein peptide amidase A